MTGVFTAEELDELRHFDAEIDAHPLTAEDWRLYAVVDDLLFPEKAKRRRMERERYERRRAQAIERSKAQRETNPEREAARKRAWYIANKERILTMQKERRRLKSPK